MILQPGEIYLVETDAGKRPAVVVSREELNRGNWVVMVLITSAHFATRSNLPHSVAFQAGDFGLSKNCVAQAETLTYLSISEIDFDAGAIGVLDESKHRELIRAIGNMMDSECEPS